MILPKPAAIIRLSFPPEFSVLKVGVLMDGLFNEAVSTVGLL
jgi:hypothetical protein